MKLISHKGNVFGSNAAEENHPDYIDKTIRAGYDCEVDLWKMDEGLFLGHDKPQYKIEYNWLLDRQEDLFIHCKNLDAVIYMDRCREVDSSPTFCYFAHENDPFVLTSTGLIWTANPLYVSNMSILVTHDGQPVPENCLGICSDFVGLYK